jgi:hypothetical protein
VNTRLKYQFIASNKTQRKIALEVGIPETRMSEFVQEVKTPTGLQKKLIANALGCKTSDIF